MEALIRSIVRSLPTGWLSVVNEESLAELDKRGEIFWADELAGNDRPADTLRPKDGLRQRERN